MLMEELVQEWGRNMLDSGIVDSGNRVEVADSLSQEHQVSTLMQVHLQSLG